jgi:hypothetical protein
MRRQQWRWLDDNQQNDKLDNHNNHNDANHDDACAWRSH